MLFCNAYLKVFYLLSFYTLPLFLSPPFLFPQVSPLNYSPSVNVKEEPIARYCSTKASTATGSLDFPGTCLKSAKSNYSRQSPGIIDQNFTYHLTACCPVLPWHRRSFKSIFLSFVSFLPAFFFARHQVTLQSLRQDLNAKLSPPELGHVESLKIKRIPLALLPLIASLINDLDVPWPRDGQYRWNNSSPRFHLKIFLFLFYILIN